MRNYLVFALAFLSGGVFAAAPEDTNVGLGEVGLPVYGATSATIRPQAPRCWPKSR